MKVSVFLLMTLTGSAMAITDWDPRCPRGGMSDCMYEDCRSSGCVPGKICCPRPCGGSWVSKPCQGPSAAVNVPITEQCVKVEGDDDMMAQTRLVGGLF